MKLIKAKIDQQVLRQLKRDYTRLMNKLNPISSKKLDREYRRIKKLLS